MSLPQGKLTVRLGRCPVHGWTTQLEDWEDPISGRTGIDCGIHEEDSEGSPYDHECVMCEQKISEVREFVPKPMSGPGDQPEGTIE